MTDGSTYLGRCLNVAERVALKTSMIALEQNLAKVNTETPTSVSFWGKVLGERRDYLIVVATNTDTFIEKVFFARYVTVLS